jgi:hypothetical protein
MPTRCLPSGSALPSLSMMSFRTQKKNTPPANYRSVRFEAFEEYVTRYFAFSFQRYVRR